MYRRVLKSVLLVSLLFVLCACQWVKPKPGAEAIALVKASAAQSCEKLASSSVSVKGALGPISRKRAKVADELLTLARNEALAQQADTIVVESEVDEGTQRFGIYRCYLSGAI